MSLTQGEAVIPVRPDTSKFGRQLADGTNSALRNAEKKMNSRLTRGLGRVERTAGRAGSAFSKAVTLPMVGAGAMLAKEFMELETGARRAVNLLGDVSQAEKDRALEVVKEQTTQVRTEWGIAGQQAAEAYFTGVSGGLGGAGSDEMREALSTAAQLSIGGNTDMDSAMRTLVLASETFRKEEMSNTEAADIFTAASNKSAVSLADMAGGFSVVGPLAASAGVKMDETAAALSAVTLQIPEVGSASAGLRQVFAELNRESSGLNSQMVTLGHDTLSDAVVEFGSLQGVLQALYESVGEDGDAFTGLFSSVEASTAAGALVGANAENAMAVLDEVRNAEGATRRAADYMADDTARKLATAWEDFKSNATPLVEETLPQMLDLLEDSLPVVESLVGTLVDFQDATGGMGLVAVLALGPALSLLGKTAGAVRGVVAAATALKGASAAGGAAAGGAAAAGKAGFGLALGKGAATSGLTVGAAGTTAAVVGSGLAGYGIGSYIEDKTGAGTEFGNWLADLAGLEDGGTTATGGAVIVGEKRAEVLNLPRGAQVTPLDKTGGGNTINVTVNVQAQTLDEVAVRRLAPTVADEIDRRTRQTTARRRP